MTIIAPMQRTAVVGGFSGALQERIEMLWRILEPRREARTRRELLMPHLSLQLVEGHLRPGQLHRLSRVALALEPVSIRLEGLGTFAAPRRVVFIRVEKNPELATIQRVVTRQLNFMGFDSHPLYQPETWVPHISILLDAAWPQEKKLFEALERRGYFSGTTEVARLLVFQNREPGQVQLDQQLGVRVTRPQDRGTSYR